MNLLCFKGYLAYYEANRSRGKVVVYFYQQTGCRAVLILNKVLGVMFFPLFTCFCVNCLLHHTKKVKMVEKHIYNSKVASQHPFAGGPFDGKKIRCILQQILCLYLSIPDTTIFPLLGQQPHLLVSGLTTFNDSLGSPSTKSVNGRISFMQVEKELITLASKVDIKPLDYGISSKRNGLMSLINYTDVT